jgi:hypothetical protein
MINIQLSEDSTFKEAVGRLLLSRVHANGHGGYKRLLLNF